VGKTKAKKKSMFVRHFKKWNAPQIFIYLSHDMSSHMPTRYHGKIIIIIKKIDAGLDVW
jgi:hypothetical protein